MSQDGAIIALAQLHAACNEVWEPTPGKPGSNLFPVRLSTLFPAYRLRPSPDGQSEAMYGLRSMKPLVEICRSVA